ncbi:MAG: hypothetical protein AUJ55_05255 [Proteobacteria bacterium CG1_02_64_396]|nr:MAG: hypothetical protein AUJ55_05255 [Proteobacteria bacterium CG1_02_64_396]
MTHLADAPIRAQAIDPGASFIVQAPAGSGKTGLLTQRFLALLATVQRPEEVVAITFTRKAAAEMRGRILQALADADLPPPGEDFQKITWDLARAARRQEQSQNWDLTRNPGRLRILTIDAFCGALTRQMPWLARFGAQPGIGDEAGDLFAEAARRLLAELEQGGDGAGEALETLLLHLDNDLSRVEKLLAGMLARRDQWLRHLKEGEGARLERVRLEGGLRYVLAEELSSLVVTLPEQDELLTLGRYAAGNLCSEGKEQAPQVALLGRTTPLTAHPDDLPAWRGVAALLLTGQGDWRSPRGINKNCGFPTELPDTDKGTCKQWKQRMGAVLERLSASPEADRFLALLQGLDNLPTPVYDEAQWQTLEAVLSLLPRAVAHLRRVFGEQGEVDHVEVMGGAIQALGGGDNPSELLLRLDATINHLLIDEFQDTSRSQFELLGTLIAGWQPGDGRTLFLVGDPMQSIYRFREAEVGLFVRIMAEGRCHHWPLTPLQLTVNFRSRAGIVAWVNRAFPLVLPAEPDPVAGGVPYAASVAARPAAQGEAATFHPLLEGAQEGEVVAELAQQAIKRGSVAILVRARTSLPPILAALAARSIPFQAVEIEPLARRPVVQDLVQLARALVHLGDRLAWLAILRAPWCGLTLADLTILAGGEGKTAAVWGRMNNPEVAAALSPDGQARLVRIVAILAPALGHTRRGRLRGRVEGVWRALGGPACLNHPTELEEGLMTLDLIGALEEGGDLPDPARLDAKLQQLFALPDPEGVVQVMTIHKSKGLEFDTVILPSLERRPNNQETPLLRWVERPRAMGGQGEDEADLLVAPLHPTGGEGDPIYRYLGSLGCKMERLETGRLLYVAATRARERLHGIGSLKIKEDKNGVRSLSPPSGGSLLAHLWPAVGPIFEGAMLRAGVEAAHIEGALPTVAPPLRRLPADWHLVGLPAPLPLAATPSAPAAQIEVEFDWAGEAAKHVGTVVHRMLERIGKEGLSRWGRDRVAALEPAFARQLAALGVPTTERFSAVAKVVRALLQTLEDPKGRWIFDTAHTQVRTEYPLTGIEGGQPVHKVIDRTFVDGDGTRWIVDFKTGGHAGGGADEFLDREVERYRGQLLGYARLFQRLEDRPVKLGLYFPLVRGGWREVAG